MCNNAWWFMGSCNSGSNADFDWGVTYYPVSETGTAVSPCGDWAAAVSKDCENPDAAGEFLQWLMNSEKV